MARNLKEENIKKLSKIETTNGFKVDTGDYKYNPSRYHEYPNLIKIIDETLEYKTVRYFRYFKFYDGNGEYQVQDVLYSEIESDASGSRIGTVIRDETLVENVRRFSMKKLIELAEADE